MTVTKIHNSNQLPKGWAGHPETAKTLADAQAYADRIGRDVLWLESGHTAFAVGRAE